MRYAAGCLAVALILCAGLCLAEGKLAGTLTEAGYDVEALMAEAPLVTQVQVDNGGLSFAAGALTDLSVVIYGADGEVSGELGLGDFTYENGVWSAASPLMTPGADVDIATANAAGYGTYSTSEGGGEAWLQDGAITIGTDGAVTIADTDGVTLHYNPSGRLTSYTYTDDAGMDFTYSVSGRLMMMTGGIDALGGQVLWTAENGWFIWQASADEAGAGEWVQMTNAQITDALPYALAGKPMRVEWKRQWYPDNTACVMGLSLRDMDPARTDKWYNVLPVRVDQDGQQTFSMVASNLYIVGKVAVTVRGDWVTVDYRYFGDDDDILSLGETVAWFTSMDQLTPEYLAAPVSNCRFGKRISRTKDLNGQPVALLFICNRVTYAQPYTDTGALLTRYWPNHPRYVKYREQLTGLLAAIE